MIITMMATPFICEDYRGLVNKSKYRKECKTYNTLKWKTNPNHIHTSKSTWYGTQLKNSQLNFGGPEL